MPGHYTKKKMKKKKMIKPMKRKKIGNKRSKKY